MRTTIEVPDDLLTRAKVRAALDGITLKQLFVNALERQVADPSRRKHRNGPPVMSAPGFREPATEEITEAMFPIEYINEQLERDRRERPAGAPDPGA
jgi:hypothetical protein